MKGGPWLDGIEIVDPGATGAVTFPVGSIEAPGFVPIGGMRTSDELSTTLLREEAGPHQQPDRSLATTTGHLDLLRTRHSDQFSLSV